MAETNYLDYLIPGLLSLGGAAIGSAGSNAAANKYIGGLDQAASLYKESAGQARQDIQGMYNTARQGLQPYAQAGNKALNQYGSYLYGDPSQAQQRLEQTPGYQWSLSQGSEAVNRAMAGQGYNLSGNRAIALQEYGQGLASQTYQNQLDNLYKLSSQGQNAAGNLANLASSTGANLANVQTGLGTALSGLASERGQVAGAEAAGQYGAFGGVLGDLAQQYGQQTMQEELINMLGGKGASTAAGQAIQSVLNDSGISSYLANTFGTSQATGVGLANSVFGGAAATTGYLGTGVGSGLVGGSALSSGVTGGSLGSTYSGVQGANLLGSLTPTSSVAAPGAGAGAGASTVAGSGFAGMAPLSQLGIIGAAIALPSIFQSFKGGSLESAKVGKLFNKVQSTMSEDPSGASTKQYIDGVITDKEWPGELNGDDIGQLYESGSIDYNYPTLHSGKSIINVWADDMTSLDNSIYSTDPSVVKGIVRNTRAFFTSSPKAFQDVYGMSEKDAKIAKDLLYRINPQGGMPGRGVYEEPSVSDMAAFSALLAAYEPQRKAKAFELYAKLDSANYTSDLSKLEKYLGVQ